MQSVSQAWKDNQNKTLVSESDIEISLKMTDPDAYEDAMAEDNGRLFYADTEYIVSDGDKVVTPYTTLERNLWLLDGSKKIVPDNNYGQVGFITDELCSADKVFNGNPIITVNFSKVHTNLLQGVTIRWSEFLNEYAEEFIVTAYNGNKIVANKTVTDNDKVLSIVLVDISNYDRITVEIVKWSMAYRRARIDELFIGVMKIFSKASVFSYNASQSIDPISAELPKADVSFAIDNKDGLYNPYNIEGISKYLIERQEINVRYGYKLDTGIEWIKGGKFYISEWNAKQNGIQADFKARDLLEFMTGTYYRGLYNPNGTNLYDLAEDVLLDANLPLNSDGSVKWVIDERLKDIYTISPLPMDTHANCLKMIANASGSVFYQDRQGILHIEIMSIEGVDTRSTDYSISHFNSYSKSDLSLSKPLKQVDVACYSYSIASETTELYKGNMNIAGTSDVTITYSGSATRVSAKVSGGTINSATYYSNACVLNITAAGNVEITVTGYTIESSSILITTSSGLTGETVSVDNPLITSQERAVVIGSWVESYMKNRMTLSSDWRADPRLDALDVVDNENDYNVNKVIMTSVKYKYNGAFRGSGEGRVI